ncbi:hypothetical protein [Chitinophaga sp. Cy-1792]|uniref:hypothetical protein n=1 Tax=Chitinophaga sp. Cy-1792 TaxID=2608339 RepID=UPI001423EBE1|nr:hypothetical protein [Chitinophaga sp. Cy-1792]NIG54279.1 hypothetical protein [Chitinophaga sp. Cy-1792]
MGLLDFFRNKKANIKISESADTSERAAAIATQLEDLGYFKYAAAGNLQQLKSEIGKELVDKHFLSFVTMEESPYTPLDPRHFSLDGEDLFEQGGITNALKEMQPLFKQMNISMEITAHVEECDSSNQGLNHEITINGKAYTIFHEFVEGYGWDQAGQRFADMINDQLQLQGSDERIYLISGGNDGRAVFLTEQQFNLLDSLITDLYEKPLKVADWCALMKVERVSVM